MLYVLQLSKTVKAFHTTLRNFANCDIACLCIYRESYRIEDIQFDDRASIYAILPQHFLAIYIAIQETINITYDYSILYNIYIIIL